MRYFEFTRSLTEDLSKDALRSLVNVIDYFKSRMETENTSQKLSPSILVTTMQNKGYESFNFKDLLYYYENSPELQNIISRPEKGMMLDILDSDAMPPTTDLTQTEPADQETPYIPQDTLSPEPAISQNYPNNLEGPLSSEPSGPIEGPEGTEQTVKSMAKKALKRRQ